MASLYISYFGKSEGGCAGAPISGETVTTSTTSAQGAVNTKGASLAFLFSDTAHWVTMGSSPTATSTNGFYLPANVNFPVDLDGLDKRFAAITA